MEKAIGNIKISSLENDILKLEFSENDLYSDKDSLFVVAHKSNQEEFLIHEEDNLVKVLFKGFVFTFNKLDLFNTLVVFKNDSIVYRHHDTKNAYKLPVPNKTPEIYALSDSSHINIDEGNSSQYVLDDNKALYLLICEKNYLKLREQIIYLTGKNDLPRFKNFGLFASKTSNLSQKSAIELIHQYELHNIPVDTFVLDKGWEDETLFQNLEDFIRFAHKRGIQVILKVEPEFLHVNDSSIENEQIKAKSEAILKLFSKGVDGWWLDTNSYQSLTSRNKDIFSKSLENHIYFDLSKQFHLGFTLDQDVYERTLFMSGVNLAENIDSKFHRYSLISGMHTRYDEQSLRSEIVNMNLSVNNMIAHYSSDIGGYEGKPHKNQYIRWFEFGVFSPVLRPYCSPLLAKGREPWNFDKTTFEICKTYLNMRYALLNSFYTAAYKNVESGLGICAPLYLSYPDDKRCYKEDASYLIGNSILVAPVSGADKPHSLKQNNFVNGLKLTIYPNGNFKGPKSYTRSVKSFGDINKFYNIVKARNPKIKSFSFRFKGDLKLKHEYQLSIKNFVKSRIFLNKKEVFNDFENHINGIYEISKIKRNKVYHLVVETVQHRRAKELDLVFYKIAKPTAKTKVYLPEGEWFNIFHRNVYQGRRYVKEKYKIDETPIFVKAGSLIPLYKKLGSTSKLSFKAVIYDYYTSKKEIVEDYFYEDDGITTAYSIGEYRKNEYKTYFENNRYVIEFKGNPKLLDDELKAREVFFKAHIRDNETIEKVLINGEPVKFKRHDHARKAVPFLDPKFARDSKTLSFKFKHIIKNDYKIELFVREK